MNKTIFILISAFTLLATACKKDNSPAPEPPSPFLGYWQGSYNTTGFIGNTKYAMLIKPGGIARVYDMGTETDTLLVSPTKKVDAVWAVTGNTLQTSYQSGSKTINTTATVNAAYTLMTGTWGYNGLVKGNIILNK